MMLSTVNSVTRPATGPAGNTVSHSHSSAVAPTGRAGNTVPRSHSSAVAPGQDSPPITRPAVDAIHQGDASSTGISQYPISSDHVIALKPAVSPPSQCSSLKPTTGPTESNVSEPRSTEPAATESILSQRVASEPFTPKQITSQPIISQPIGSAPIVSEPVASDSIISKRITSSECVAYEPEGCSLLGRDLLALLETGESSDVTLIVDNTEFAVHRYYTVFCPGFQKGGYQFSKRAFSARCSMIKKALTIVISTFYQHFDDYFCDGHLFDSSLFICLTIVYKLMPNCFYFWEQEYFFLFGSLKRAGC